MADLVAGAQLLNSWGIYFSISVQYALPALRKALGHDRNFHIRYPYSLSGKFVI